MVFLLVWVISSCFFACLLIFYWMSDIVNFTFLGGGYLYIFLHILLSIVVGCCSATWIGLALLHHWTDLGHAPWSWLFPSARPEVVCESWASPVWLEGHFVNMAILCSFWISPCHCLPFWTLTFSQHPGMFSFRSSALALPSACMLCLRRLFVASPLFPDSWLQCLLL